MASSDGGELPQQHQPKRSRPHEDLSSSNNNDMEESLDSRDTKKAKTRWFHPDIPTTQHYHVSWMHASVVTCAVASIKHGYVVTGSADGVVKFWKRLTIESPHENHQNNDTSTSTLNNTPTTHAGLEFVKSFTAHTDAVLALAMDAQGDACVSVGADGWLKFYDVSTFDVSTMMHLAAHISKWKRTTSDPTHIAEQPPPTPRLGRAGCWLHDPVTSMNVVAVASADCGDIYICDAQQLLQIISLHGSSVVTTLTAIPGRCSALSTDCRGIVEVWSTASNSSTGSDDNNSNNMSLLNNSHDEHEDDATATTTNKPTLAMGGPCTSSRHGITYSSKMDTDLYELVRKKTHAMAACASHSHFALLGADQRLRLFDYAAGKMLVAFDERPQVYETSLAQHGMDAMEYGRRVAMDREIMANVLAVSQSQSESSPPPPNTTISMQFDPSGKYLLIPTIMGIKVLDWRRRKLMGWIGQADASQCRFLSVCLAHGDARMNQQILLARKASTKTSAGMEANAQDENAPAKITDALVIALAHDKRRFYVFSHVDPVLDPDAPEDIVTRRDIWNEAPTVEDRLFHSDVRAASDNVKTASKAILRTTMGDIHIQLFTQVPKTIENFVGHSQSGYYDGVIFHRVIKGFMIQTGDPLGDGTGGESIWGGEFEDEFVPGLRHDRPFTVAMANSGPNTSGSQFYVTTVPTPWLDNKHTVFGRVVQGMDVCTAIENVKTDDLDKPLEEIRIHNIDLE